MSNVIVQEALRGKVYRSKPTANSDGTDAYARMGRYGELIVNPIYTKNTTSANEGSYYVNMNPSIGTGVKLQGDTTTGFVATTPSILIVNNDQVGGKNIMVDYAKLLVTAAGAGLAQLQCAVLLDTANRYASGGTDVSANTKNTNTLVSDPTSICKVYYGATASAASANVKQVGRACLRAAIPVVNDQYILNFGGEPNISASQTAGTSVISQNYDLAPIVLGPQHSLLIYLFAASMSTSPSTEFEIGWIER